MRRSLPNRPIRLGCDSEQDFYTCECKKHRLQTVLFTFAENIHKNVYTTQLWEISRAGTFKAKKNTPKVGKESSHVTPSVT